MVNRQRLVVAADRLFVPTDEAHRVGDLVSVAVEAPELAAPLTITGLVQGQRAATGIIPAGVFVHIDFGHHAVVAGPHLAQLKLGQSDPSRAIATLTERLMSDGVMAFVEVAMPLDGHASAMWWPRNELSPNVSAWIEAAFAATRVVPWLGVRLPSMFRAAGLEPQDVEAVCIAYRGQEAAVMNASLIRSMLPVIIEHDIATADEIDIDTLADRLFAAAGDDFVYLLPPAVASWARRI